MDLELLQIIRLNSTVAGLMITAGIYIQCIKVFRTKSAKDFSPMLVLALLYFEISWLIYGVGIKEWPVIAMTMTTLPADIGVAVGYALYGGRRSG